MGKRVYGQYCGFARALELVGERWALMIVRDLLVEPRRFSDLERSLFGIPPNILTARLKEMAEAGLVRRRASPRPNGGTVYELTEVGLELEPAVMALGRWGAKLLGNPRDGEILTADSLVVALRATFHRKAANGLNAIYELHAGDIALHAQIRNGRLTVNKGPSERCDLSIEVGPALRALLAHEITPQSAVKNGHVRLNGKRALFGRFVEIFHL
jgi:DNA-binding HxlR family transcriptional regulator